MDDTRALLDAYAAELWATTLSERPLEEFAPKAFAALRAVLDQHQRDDGACTDCSQIWPCATVKAVTAALEES